MRYFQLLLLFGLLADSCENPSASALDATVEVSGTLLEAAEYCGGAAPSDEVLADIRRPRPLAGKKLFLRSGEENLASQKILLEFTSGSDGRFSFRLPPGLYCLIDERRKNSLDDFRASIKKSVAADPSLTASDDSCALEEFQRCDAVLRVIASPARKHEVILRKSCTPPCTSRFIP